jgi:hypothetical protein
MRTTSVLAALSFAAAVSAQAVEIGIEPDEPAPEGCETTSKSNFTIGYQSLSTMRRRETALEVCLRKIQLERTRTDESSFRLATVQLNAHSRTVSCTTPEAGSVRL